MLLEQFKTPIELERQVVQTADIASLRALLNCLLRELALPGGWVRYQWPEVKSGLAVVDAGGEGIPLLVTMPDGGRYFILVDRRDPFGSQRYLSDLWGCGPGQAWRRLDLAGFACDLLDRCADVEAGVNAELLGQIHGSRDTLVGIFEEAGATGPDELADYGTSEQAVWLGHPVHPAPKARVWTNPGDERRFAPEYGATFRLHRWDVDRGGLDIRTSGLNEGAALAAVADQAGVAPGRAILSLHPAQAKLLLCDERVRREMACGQIRDLGATGRFARATASVRTLLVDGGDHLLKTSLAIRITNCVRKNAWYELQSAVLINGVLEKILAGDPDGCGGLSVIPEPASLSWAPAGAEPDATSWFREQTGTILRHDFQRDHEDDALLACTVFGRDTGLRPLAAAFLGTDPAVLRQWFRGYAALLMRPVLTAFFRHGIVFEPHLQNCVILLRGRQPTGILFRDFEGVKLTEDKGLALIDGAVAAKVRASMTYSRERGWKRVAYCLLVNNLSEAVLALSYETPGLAPDLWAIVADTLRTIRAELACDAPEFDAMLAGGPIPAKANFRTRLAAAPDREASYVELASPWGMAQ